MTTELPGALQTLLKVTVGMPWPEGDEGDLRELAWEWEAMANELDSLSAELTARAGDLSEVMEGATSDAIQQMLSVTFREGAVGLGEQARAYTEMLENAAADIQKTKIMIIGMLGVLAATSAVLFSSLFGSALVPGLIAAARVGIGVLLRTLVAQLMRYGLVNIARTLATRMVGGAAFGVGFMVGLDSAIQGSQIAAGKRNGFDTESLKGGAIGGAIGGALGGLGEGAVGIFAKVGRDLGRMLPRFLRGVTPSPTPSSRSRSRR